MVPPPPPSTVSPSAPLDVEENQTASEMPASIVDSLDTTTSDALESERFVEEHEDESPPNDDPVEH